MIKKIIFIAFLFSAFMVAAQMGVNIQDPKSTLEVKAVTTDGSKPEGLLIPRLTADQVKSMTEKSNVMGWSQNSLLVYITESFTTSVGGKFENINGPGYYYYHHDFVVANSRWIKLLDSGDTKGIKNIYTADGTITGQRNVTLANESSNITFSKSGATNNNPLLVVNGTVKMTAADMNSDERLKQNITDLHSRKLGELRSVSYFWNDEGKKRGGNDKLQYGFIAQEVEKVYPNLVSTDKDGYKSVNYIQLIPILTKALQDERQINREQQEQLLKQAEEIEKLKVLVEQQLMNK